MLGGEKGRKMNCSNVIQKNFLLMIRMTHRYLAVIKLKLNSQPRTNRAQVEILIQFSCWNKTISIVFGKTSETDDNSGLTTKLVTLLQVYEAINQCFMV